MVVQGDPALQVKVALITAQEQIIIRGPIHAASQICQFHQLFAGRGTVQQPLQSGAGDQGFWQSREADNHEHRASE